MDILLKSKTVDEIIGYYISIYAIWNKLADLVEETDVIAEDFEYSEWLKDDANGEKNGIMDLHVFIEDADEKARQVVKEAEKKLCMVMEIAIENQTGFFGPYENKLKKEDVSWFMDYVSEEFGNIYEPSDYESSVANFKSAIIEAAEELVNNR